jgi:hypothetical protein
LPRRSLVTAALAIAIALATIPTPTTAASLVNKATMFLQTTYLLRSTLSYTNGTITTAETISVRNTSGGTISKLNLSVMPKAFGELTSIGGYTVDGREVGAAWSNNSNLVLQLGRNVADGQTVEVKLSFKVRASSIIGTSLEGRLSKANGIMQVSHWFPIISSGHGMRYPGDSQFTRVASRIRLELTTDSSSVKIAAPGRVVLRDGRRHIYELVNARDFAFGASPTYKTVSGSSAGATISVYYTTGAGATALSHAKAALARFESAFGAYGWSRFVIAQTGRKGSGNEYPGIVFIGSSLMGSREVVAHETAHQWWYAMVGNEQIREPWIDEGLAEFATKYFYGDFETYHSSLPVNTSSSYFPNLPSPETASEPNSYAQTIYYKSAKFLEGLRIRMGTTAFFKGLRALFAANRNGVLTTREFYDGMLDHGTSRAYLDAFIKL